MDIPREADDLTTPQAHRGRKRRSRHLPALPAHPSGAVGSAGNGSVPVPVITGFDGDAMPGPR